MPKFVGTESMIAKGGYLFGKDPAAATRWLRKWRSREISGVALTREGRVRWFGSPARGLAKYRIGCIPSDFIRTLKKRPLL